MTSVADFDWTAVIHELERPDGWTKHQFGVYWKRHGAVCFYGACLRVDNYGDTHDVSYLRTAEDIICEQFPDRIDDTGIITPFNDHPDTTLADVVLVAEKSRVRAGELA